MGSGVSCNFPDTNNEVPASGKPPSLGDLPENCLAMILDQFDPPEICNLARVNRTFYRASSADFLWESRLPENYEVLVKKMSMVYESDRSRRCLCKKDIYGMLCCPVRLPDGTKEVWCEKGKGGMCMMVSWRGMKITGIHDRRYWTHINTLQSRFHTIAYLQRVWWLEVEGDVDFEFPVGHYSLFFRLHLGKAFERQSRYSASNNHEVHGWTLGPVRFKFSISNGQSAMSKYFLDEQGKWICFHVGDFLVEHSYEPTKINFSMTLIDCTHQKGGLSLDSVLICPRDIGP